MKDDIFHENYHRQGKEVSSGNRKKRPILLNANLSRIVQKEVSYNNQVWRGKKFGGR